MKRRTKQAQVRAALARADKPSGKSRYARKESLQRRGRFGLRSPFRVVMERAAVLVPASEIAVPSS